MSRQESLGISDPRAGRYLFVGRPDITAFVSELTRQGMAENTVRTRARAAGAVIARVIAPSWRTSLLLSTATWAYTRRIALPAIRSC